MNLPHFFVNLKRFFFYNLQQKFQVELTGLIYNAVRVRSFSTKLQVDTCKSKEDRSVHAQLHNL